MKRNIRLLCISFCIIFSFHSIVFAESEIGNLTFMLGRPVDVKVKHAGQEKWTNAQLKMKIFNQDIIKTSKEARCEVKLLDGSIIRIGESSEFEFNQANVTNSTKDVKAAIKKGKIWANLKKMKGKQESFQIKTPTAVCAVRGTIYRIDSGKESKFLVYDGIVDVGPNTFWGKTEQTPTKSLKPVEVPGPHEIPPPYQVSLDEWVKIVKGYQIIVRPDGKFAKSKFDDDKDSQLDWVKWNKNLDTQGSNTDQ